MTLKQRRIASSGANGLAGREVWITQRRPRVASTRSRPSEDRAPPSKLPNRCGTGNSFGQPEFDVVKRIAWWPPSPYLRRCCCPLVPPVRFAPKFSLHRSLSGVPAPLAASVCQPLSAGAADADAVHVGGCCVQRVYDPDGVDLCALARTARSGQPEPVARLPSLTLGELPVERIGLCLFRKLAGLYL